MVKIIPSSALGRKRLGEDPGRVRPRAAHQRPERERRRRGPRFPGVVLTSGSRYFSAPGALTVRSPAGASPSGRFSIWGAPGFRGVTSAWKPSPESSVQRAAPAAFHVSGRARAGAAPPGEAAGSGHAAGGPAPAGHRGVPRSPRLPGQWALQEARPIAAATRASGPPRRSVLCGENSFSVPTTTTLLIVQLGQS